MKGADQLINRMTATALDVVTKIAGSVVVEIDGQEVNAFLVRDERGLDPMLGGMVSPAAQNILVSKSQLPTRPIENAPISFLDGELAGADLVAGAITDRRGYWLITCDESIL